jgi:hypothetical protein
MTIKKEYGAKMTNKKNKRVEIKKKIINHFK